MINWQFFRFGDSSGPDVGKSALVQEGTFCCVSSVAGFLRLFESSPLNRDPE